MGNQMIVCSTLLWSSYCFVKMFLIVHLIVKFIILLKISSKDIPKKNATYPLINPKISIKLDDP